MQIEMVIAELEANLASQVRLGGDPAIDEAGEALTVALRPAVRQLIARIAEQAAAEVDAQLPDRSVRVVLSDGTPSLVVQIAPDFDPVDPSELEARLTLRLTDALKAEVEAAAGQSGDSVNTYVVKTLGARTRSQSQETGGSFRGRIET